MYDQIRQFVPVSTITQQKNAQIGRFHQKSYIMSVIVYYNLTITEVVTPWYRRRVWHNEIFGRNLRAFLQRCNRTLCTSR